VRPVDVGGQVFTELSWPEIVELRNDLVQHGLPDDPSDVRVRLAEAVANAEGLRVLFAGQRDHGSVAYVHELLAEWRDAVTWRRQQTHSGSATRQ
jgi:hypothetical protein